MERIYPLHSARNFYLSRILSDKSRLIRISHLYISLTSFVFQEFIRWRKITGLGESGNRLIFVSKRSLIGLSDFDITELRYNGIWYRVQYWKVSGWKSMFELCPLLFLSNDQSNIRDNVEISYSFMSNE